MSSVPRSGTVTTQPSPFSSATYKIASDTPASKVTSKTAFFRLRKLRRSCTSTRYVWSWGEESFKLILIFSCTLPTYRVEVEYQISFDDSDCYRQGERH